MDATRCLLCRIASGELQVDRRIVESDHVIGSTASTDGWTIADVAEHQVGVGIIYY